VPMRIHWPRHADLRINNMVYRPYSRNSATKLGANARDEPASVAVMCPQVPIPAPSSILSTHSPAKKLPSARSMSPFLNAFSGSSVRRLQCSPEDGILLVFGSLVPPHKNSFMWVLLSGVGKEGPCKYVLDCLQGRNRLWLSAMESRSFCVMVQLAQRRTLDEVKALMAPPETVQAALQRVVRQVTNPPPHLCKACNFYRCYTITS
jgi:hypothetical protein